MRTLNTREYWDDLTSARDAGMPTRAATLSVTGFDDRIPIEKRHAPRQVEAHAADLRHTAATSGGFDRRAAAWLSLGFLSGMIAWHAVGFWTFVTSTVLNDDSTAPAAFSHPRSMPTPKARPAPSSATAVENVPGCVALAYGAGGKTISKPCQKIPAPLRDAGRLKRTDRMASAEDRLHSAAIWSNRTAATETTQNTSAKADTATIESAFDLSLSVD